MPYPLSVDAGGTQPWYLAHEANIITFQGSAAALTANTTYITGVYLPSFATATKMRTRASSPSGNLDMGIYDESGNLLAHTGVTAAVNNLNEVSLSSSIALSPGRYYLALWVSTGDSYYRGNLGSIPTTWGNIRVGTSTNSGGLLSTFTAMGGTTVTGPIVNMMAVLSGGF